MMSSTAPSAPRACRPRPVTAGFTLIELLVTITVLAVLAMVAVPAFNDAILSSRLSSFSNNFMASAQLARSEAIKRNAPVKMCRSANGTTCATSGGWQQGWIVFNDTDNDGTLDTNETRIHYQQPIGDDYAFTGDQYTISFQPTGLSATTAALKLCRLTPSPGSQERAITLSTTGRVATAVTKEGTCTSS